MNLNWILVSLNLFGITLSMKKDEGYFHMFIHAHNLMEESEFNIKNSLKEYSNLVKIITESTNFNSLYSFINPEQKYESLENMAAEFAGNVTLKPAISTSAFPQPINSTTLPEVTMTTQYTGDTSETTGGNSTQPNIKPTAEPQQVSKLCQIQTSGVMNGINTQQFWALKSE